MNYQFVMSGLGNPGAKYHGTRHNLGFAFIDHFIEQCAAHGQAEELSGSKFKCELWRVKQSLNSPWWLVAKPLTFMNLSGTSLYPLLAWYRLETKQLIVVHDELDIVPGQMRFKFGGGNAGHNGLKSITEHCATPDFYRLRLGIGRPSSGEDNDVAKYVLNKPSKEDNERLTGAFAEGVRVLDVFCAEGLAPATKYALTVR